MKHSMEGTPITTSKLCAATVLVCLLAGSVPESAPAQSAAAISWDSRYYDPAGNADLLLPLPCGGAMAFQRVDTPVPAGDPTADRTVQLGLATTDSGYADYLRRAFIRGGFSGEGGGAAHYFIGRYELTSDQLAALRGPCPKPSPRGAVPAAGLSWFDAVEAARSMTEWLRAEAPGALPAEEGTAGFVRLPTETEWEYAVRGGATVDISVFNQRTFPIEGEIRRYAWHQGARSARGKLRPVGLLRANPIGLHDVYGNAEELMFAPFRMNALGRPHGQPGGIVTRGGSILSTPSEFSSGLRQEFPAFGATGGRPVALDTFGVRFAIGVHLSVSTERTNRLRATWLDNFSGTGERADGVGDDLSSALDAMIAAEVEHDRRTRLEAVRLLAAEERRERKAGRLQALKALLLGGAVLVQFLREDAMGIDLSRKALAAFDETIEQASDGKGVIDAKRLEELRANRGKLVAGIENREGRFSLNFLSYERNLVTSATEYAKIERRRALDVLLEELKASGRAALAPLAQEFYGEVVHYSANPDMTTDDIRRLVLER